MDIRELREPAYEIRWAAAEDWPAVMDMVWRTFMCFEAPDYTEEGIASFRDFLTDGRIYRMFQEGSYLMMIALDGDKVVGEISLRNRNHISLLFVEETYHRRGIGRALIKTMGEYLKKEKQEMFMSVSAAPYAVDFYRRIGFHACAPEEEYSGIRVTPMEKFL